jgi:hypothetical protein
MRYPQQHYNWPKIGVSRKKKRHTVMFSHSQVRVKFFASYEFQLLRGSLGSFTKFTRLRERPGCTLNYLADRFQQIDLQT